MSVLIDPAKSSHAIGPGVFGYTVETLDGLYIPVVVAQRPGHGDVGRWLDSLPRDRRIVFASVYSPVLAGMLQRRGWAPITERDPRTGDDVPCWERLDAVAAAAALSPLEREVLRAMGDVYAPAWIIGEHAGLSGRAAARGLVALRRKRLAVARFHPPANMNDWATTEAGRLVAREA